MLRNPHTRSFAGAVLGFCLAIPAFAQSNERIDELLGQREARVDSAAYIALSAGGLIGEGDSPERAFALLLEEGWLDGSRKPEEPVLIDEFSFIVMKALNLPGGVLYTVFPGRRYAYRELVFLDVVNGSGGPGRTMSGEEVIRILRGALARKGGGQ